MALKIRNGITFTIRSTLRRSLALILALILLIPVSSGTASAESVDNDGSFLDVFELHPNTPRTRVVYGQQPFIQEFALPSISRVFSVEFYIFYNGPGSPDLYIGNGISSTSYNLQCVSLGNSLYKFNGNVSLAGWSQVQIVLWFPGLADGEKSYFTFLDFKVNYLNKEEFATDISYFATVDGELYFDEDSYSGYIIPDVVSSGSSFRAEISVPVHRTLDAFYFLIHSGYIHISSIECQYPVDFDLICTDPDPNSLNNIYSTLRVELPESYRNDFITVTVSGTAYPGAYFCADNCFGIVRTDPPSPLFVWLEKINSSVSSLPSQMASAIAAAFNNVSLKYSIDLGISETIDSLSNFVTKSFDGIKETISTTGSTFENISSTLTGNVESLMNTFTGNVESLMTTLIDNLNSFLSTLVGQVESLIASFTGSIESLMNSLTADVVLLVESLTDSVNNLINNLLSSLTTAVDDLLQTLTEFLRIEKRQEISADSFLDDSDNQSGDLNEVIGNMQTPKPNMGDIDTSLDGISGGSEFAVFNTAIVTLSSGDIVTRLLLVAVSLMLVSYVFFGKKG